MAFDKAQETDIRFMNSNLDANAKQWLETFQSLSSGWDNFYKDTSYNAYAKQSRMQYAMHLSRKYCPNGK